MKGLFVFLALCVGACFSINYFKCTFNKNGGTASWNDPSIWANCNNAFPNNTADVYDALVTVNATTLISINGTVFIGQLFVGNNVEQDPVQISQVIAVNSATLNTTGFVSINISGAVFAVKSVINTSNIQNAGKLAIVDSNVFATKLYSNGQVVLTGDVQLFTEVSSEGDLDIVKGNVYFNGPVKAVDLRLDTESSINLEGNTLAVQTIKNQGNISWSNTTDWSPFAIGTQIASSGELRFNGDMTLNIGARNQSAGTIANSGKVFFYDDFTLFGEYWNIGQTYIYRECHLPVVYQGNAGFNSSFEGEGSLTVKDRFTWSQGYIATDYVKIEGLLDLEGHVTFSGKNFTLGENSTVLITLTEFSSEPMFTSESGEIFFFGNISLSLSSKFQPKEGDVVTLFTTGGKIYGDFGNTITPKMAEGANSNGCSFEYQLTDTDYTMTCTIQLSSSSDGPQPRHASHGGAIAAGILIPLAVIGAAIGAYFYWKRGHNKGYRPL